MSERCDEHKGAGMPLIMGMSVLLACQFAGELVARGLGVPVPGPVVGMVILLLGLMVLGRVPSSLRITGEGLLRYLTLLFVPAGVGLMVHARLIGMDFWPIVATLIISTALTLAVTAWVLERMQRRYRRGETR
ncbi:CidA/LrgA family protein [Halomonas chromatireducens]